MNTIKTVISTVVLLAASTLFAQSGSTCCSFPKGEDGPGLIGKRYAEVGVGIQDPQQYSDTSISFGTAVNVPLSKNIDVGIGYNYSTLNYTPMGATPDVVIDSSSHSIGVNATIYNTIDKGIKPFLSVNLGHTASSITVLGGDHDTNYQWWGVSTGAEFPFKWVSVITSLGYDDDFKRSAFSSQDWYVKAEVNTWITNQVGAYVGLAFVRPMHNYVSSYVWSAGARVRF